MDNKEILRNIVLEDEITNISFNENTFTIYFGDVENTDKEGHISLLLETYIEIPYDFTANNLKLHRGIVDILECNPNDNNEYSGFVHYNGYSFCYGGCGVDHTCNIIRADGLTSDLFNKLIIQFQNYLSHSSHNTIGTSWRKIEFTSNTTVTNTVDKFITIDGLKIPQIIKKTTTNTVLDKLVYTEPYEFIKEVPSKKFTYNNEIITPKIVKHKIEGIIQDTHQYIGVDVRQILKNIKQKTIQKYKDEINLKPKYTTENFLHKLTDKYSRVDGSFYI
jgi:hypothetical protein